MVVVPIPVFSLPLVRTAEWAALVVAVIPQAVLTRMVALVVAVFAALVGAVNKAPMPVTPTKPSTIINNFVLIYLPILPRDPIY